MLNNALAEFIVEERVCVKINRVSHRGISLEQDLRNVLGGRGFLLRAYLLSADH